ncbi:hypothetical protein KA107_03285 [Candidatus Pacearchaeota archaeon]|nr:hypothetical protein [Candidatus Pacearchaeota archaeon]
MAGAAIVGLSSYYLNQVHKTHVPNPLITEIREMTKRAGSLDEAIEKFSVDLPVHYYMDSQDIGAIERTRQSYSNISSSLRKEAEFTKKDILNLEKSPEYKKEEKERIFLNISVLAAFGAGFISGFYGLLGITQLLRAPFRRKAQERRDAFKQAFEGVLPGYVLKDSSPGYSFKILEKETGKQVGDVLKTSRGTHSVKDAFLLENPFVAVYMENNSDEKLEEITAEYSRLTGQRVSIYKRELPIFF